MQKLENRPIFLCFIKLIMYVCSHVGAFQMLCTPLSEAILAKGRQRLTDVLAAAASVKPQVCTVQHILKDLVVVGHRCRSARRAW